jgi:hypothetical protein
MLVKETPARNLRKRYCYRISQNGSLRRQWPDSCRNSLVEILARSNSRGFKRRAPRWGRVTGEYRPRHLTGSLQRFRVFHVMRRLTCARVNGSSGPFDRWQSNWDLMCLMECALAIELGFDVLDGVRLCALCSASIHGLRRSPRGFTSSPPTDVALAASTRMLTLNLLNHRGKDPG